MNYSALSKLFIIFLMFSVASCDQLLDDGRITEGVIEYDVTYPKMDPNSILAELLPTKMVMHFKDNKFQSELSAGFGMFKMNVINRGNEHEMVQMVKLINDRFLVQYDETKAMAALESFPKITIQETGKKKTIAEYECKEAIATVQGDSVETFKIYFTDQIRMDDANWFTQYLGIEGVLMEYQIERYDLCTRFTASSVTAKEVDNEIFETPDDYDIINEAEMTQKMEEIFNSFSE